MRFKRTVPIPIRPPDKGGADPALDRRYTELKEKYFGDWRLPHKLPKLLWSAKLTHAGANCKPRKKEIRISIPYIKQYPEELDSVLLHEMAHLLVPNHGPQFKRVLRSINNIAGREVVSRYTKARATIRAGIYKEDVVFMTDKGQIHVPLEKVEQTEYWSYTEPRCKQQIMRRIKK